MKHIIKLDASENVIYSFYVEVDVEEKDSFVDVIEKAEEILHNADINFQDYIDDSNGFSINRDLSYDVGPTEEIKVPMLVNNIIREEN